jgi:hypothetical protein
VEPEGVGRPDGTRIARLRREAPSRAADVAADGIRNVLRSGDPDALPDSEDGQTVDLSFAVVESLAGHVPVAR